MDWPALVNAGGTIRFAVEDEAGDRRSTQYLLWGNKHADDVYVAGRDVAGWMKASLHQSGSWQHGFTKQAEEQGSVGADGRRHLERWNRPLEIASGLTHAMRIVVPTSQLRPGPSSAKQVACVAVPPPRTGDGTAFDLYLVEDDSVSATFEQSVHVGTLKLPGGGSLWIIAREMHLPNDPEGVFRAELNEARMEMEATPELRVDGMNPRIVLHQLDEDLQTLKWVEMAVDLNS